VGFLEIHFTAMLKTNHYDSIETKSSLELYYFKTITPSKKNTEGALEKKPKSSYVYSYMIAAVFLVVFLQVSFDQSVLHHFSETTTAPESFFILDACATTNPTQKTACCSNVKYPVLGGIDVVALREVHKGKPPLLGTVEFPAALPTKAGSFIFFFASKENQQQFLLDPWRYAPRWGGFDAWQIAQNSALAGEAGKVSIGINTDTSHWFVHSGQRPLMFGGPTAKANFLGDMETWVAKGDAKWKSWWGDLKEGPFNTQCLTGMSFTDLVEVSERYKSGELTMGQMTLQERFLDQTPRKLLKNAIPSARAFSMGQDGKLGTFFIEEGTRKGFDLRASVLEDSLLNGLSSDALAGGRLMSLLAQKREGTPTALLAVDRESHPGDIYYFEKSKGRLLRICTNTLQFQEIVHDMGENTPLAMTWSTCDQRLYYATPSGIYWVDRSGASHGTVLEVLGMQIIDLDSDASHLYYMDSASNQLNYAVLTCNTESNPDVPVLQSLPVPDDPVSFISPWKEGHIFFVTTTNKIYRSMVVSENSISSPTSLSALIQSKLSEPTVVLQYHEPILSLQVLGDVLYMGVSDRILSIELSSVENSEEAPKFKEVLTGIPQLLNGMIIADWPQRDGLAFTVISKYTKKGDKSVFNDYAWAAGKIIEPYLPTTLRVSEPKVPVMTLVHWSFQGDNSGEDHSIPFYKTFSYTWTFEGHTYNGTDFQVNLKKTGSYPLILREFDFDGNVVRELRTSLVCKYVRREIKTLLDEDREAFLEGLETMYTTPQAQGTLLYGPNFKNAEYFTHMHNVLAGARECDHLGQGRGFFTNLMSLTLMFEQSLQMINPALTVPYWDYTYESSFIDTYYSGDLNMLWKTSPIFRPDWFGDTHNEEFTVTEGRWAYKLKIPDDQWDQQRHNSYGMMRAPWNNNPNPFVQRFSDFSDVSVFKYNHGWPSCKDHYELSTRPLTFRDYISKMPGLSHEKIKGILAGAQNFDQGLDQLEGIYLPADMEYLRLRSAHLSRDMWRKGLSECPEYCSPETDIINCKCTCPQEKLERLDTDVDLWNLYVLTVLNGRMPATYDHDTLRFAIEVICTSGFINGDQEDSASPADPIFWPMNPTLERLYHWKLLNGGLDDMTWPDLEGNSESQTYAGSMTACLGHNPTDKLQWSIMLEGQDTASNYLNIEMMSLLDVMGNYQLPYVYDNFEWDHCSEQGYNFNKIGDIDLL